MTCISEALRAFRVGLGGRVRPLLPLRNLHQRGGRQHVCGADDHAVGLSETAQIRLALEFCRTSFCPTRLRRLKRQVSQSSHFGQQRPRQQYLHLLLGWLCKLFSVALEVFQLGALCPAAIFTHGDCLHYTDPLGVPLDLIGGIVVQFGRGGRREGGYLAG